MNNAGGFMDFDVFLEKLLQDPSKEMILRIRGKDRRIAGMARFEIENFPGVEYIKLAFDDHSFLLVMIDDEELFFTEEVVGHIQEITDDQIGVLEELDYKGKRYKLENKNDYQYVLQRYVGTYKDIEGECRFSDYFPVEGPKEFLSLGWLSRTGKRADINPVIIDLAEVEIL